jgi:hypothetical protein
MWKLALCTALFVAWSLPAAAAHGDKGHRQYRHETRRDARIQELAYRIEEATHRLHVSIDRHGVRSHRHNPKLARGLDRLDEAARRYRRAVTRTHYDSGRATRRFEELTHALHRVAKRANRRNVGPRVHRGLDHIGSLVERVQWRYARNDRSPRRAAWSVSWSH